MCYVMYFKHMHQVETQQNIEVMSFVLTWCVNIFFFFSRSLSFLILPIIYTKNKNIYLPYTIHIGSNWYMDTGVRDLEVAFLKANST